MRIKMVMLGLSLAALTLAPVPVWAATSSGGADAVTWSPKQVEVVAAWDQDLPVGSTNSISEPPMAFASGNWVCTVFAADPHFSGSTAIYASGSQTCSGSGWSPQYVKVTLQKYAGFGVWNNLVSGNSGWTTSNPVYKNITYSCWRAGSEEYRVVTDGYAVYGAYGWSVQSLNYIRVFC